MSDTAEKLRRELQAAQRALAEAQARCERHDAEHQAATSELEDNRSALLFMLEDLEAGRRKIEQAHQEWKAALDVVNDPIFLHDKEFRILRCNKAYQQCAGIPFHEIIGQPYYEIFPKTGAPLACCLRVMEKKSAAADKEEMVIGDTTYRSRTFSVYGEQGAYLHSVHILEDITENRRAEEALRKSNERFDLAVKGTNDGIWDWDIRTNTNYFSPRFLELLDYGPDELPHELATFESFLHPEDLAWVFDRVRQHLEDKVPYNVEYRMRTKNGAYRWFQARGEAIRDQSGKPFRMAGSITDISGRKQAEAQLRNSEERHRQIIQTSMDGFWITDTQGRILDVNDAYCQLTGYAREGLLNMRIADVEAKEATEETAQHIQEIMAKGYGRFETRHRRKDGQLLLLDIEVSVVHHPDTQDGYFFVFLRDITERKQREKEMQELINTANQSRTAMLNMVEDQGRTEEKLRETSDYLENLFNHANAPIIVWDPSYRITMFNHAFEHMTGRDASEVIGKQIDTLFPADRKDEALAHIYQTRTGERWKTVEIPILHSSGEVRTALWNSATLYSADGKNVVATMAQGQDITGRKQAEAQINEQLDELRRWYEAMLGREMRTLELKREINELLAQAGQPPRYLSVVSDEPGKSS